MYPEAILFLCKHHQDPTSTRTAFPFSFQRAYAGYCAIYLKLISGFCYERVLWQVWLWSSVLSASTRASPTPEPQVLPAMAHNVHLVLASTSKKILMFLISSAQGPRIKVSKSPQTPLYFAPYPPKKKKARDRRHPK